jgi:hypothetical protein
MLALQQLILNSNCNVCRLLFCEPYHLPKCAWTDVTRIATFDWLNNLQQAQPPWEMLILSVAPHSDYKLISVAWRYLHLFYEFVNFSWYCTGMAVLVGITDQATQSFTLFYYRLHRSSLQSLYYTQYRPPDVLSQSGLSGVFTSRRLA